MAETFRISKKSPTALLPRMPLMIWLVVITLVLGFMGNMSAPDLIETFNRGFGRALGEFALILLPSFVLASALSQRNTRPAQGAAIIMSPLASAGMVCPDTAYAALSPMAGRNKLEVGFGAYAGFKLLYPAGPLIVATGLGVKDTSIALYGAALLIPVWVVGHLWARMNTTPAEKPDTPKNSGNVFELLGVFAPFFILAVLLIVGASVDFSSLSLVDFATKPKGALMIAAIWALIGVPRDKRRHCLDQAIGRTGSLLLVIGIASAFGGVLTSVIPMDGILPIGESGIVGIVGLFVLAAAFKLAQGSSMATFAAIAPVAGPFVITANLSPIAAVLAICMGSFIAILPNDSFFWLLRQDALHQIKEDWRAIYILATGATLQALIGLAVILAAMKVGLI
ncbi:MAG: hypothetical protein V7727_01630 [Sneathiella sp.]